MLVTGFYPLRRVVGRSLPIRSISVVTQSAASRELGVDYTVKLRGSLDETVNDDLYQEYLPTFVLGGRTLRPALGVPTLPVRPMPFSQNDDLASLFALAGPASTDASLSRKLSVTLAVELDEPGVVGGICFGGYPYLSCRIDAHGATEPNFGLPREFRLTAVPGPGSQSGFIDAESSYTQQRVISHSGLHFIRTDPVRSRRLALRLSDYPLFLRKGVVDRLDRPAKVSRFYGFIIPYFYVFEYAERTRYSVSVPGGVLGIKTPKPPPTYTPHSFDELTGFLFPEFEFLRPVDGNTTEYAPFTPASIFGQQREFAFQNDPDNPPTHNRKGYEECFISDPIAPGKGVVLFVEQAEEYERCIAGVKIELPFIPEVNLEEELQVLFPDQDVDLSGVSRATLEQLLRRFLGIPKTVDFCERIGLKVYELDPPEGVSPASLALDGKYATLLAERTIDELSEIVLSDLLEGVRFVRPSNARYFAVVLENADSKPGQFVVKRLQLVQSASVSISPRPARTQSIRAMHFRFVGANLTEDYAGLGEEGFNFSVERVSAGETKSVLLDARSLLDLLHLGVARVYGNARRRGVEFETVETVKDLPNFESRRSSSRSAGWRRAELGQGVSPVNAWNDESLLLDNVNNRFESFAASQSRTHNKLLFPRTDNEWNAARTYFGLVTGLISVGTRSNPCPNHNESLNAPWLNPRWNPLFTFPIIRGLRNVTVSPFSPIVTLEEFIDRLSDGDVPAALTDIVSVLLTTPSLVLTAGANSSVSVGLPGTVGVSLGIVPYPSLLNNATFGSTGNIVKSATESIYSYSQALNHGLDDADTSTTIDQAVSNRQVTRAAVDGTDATRIKGAEVMWQGELLDIVSGTLPLNLTLPATGGRMFRTSDDALRVRLGSGVGTTISVDIWFDLVEEAVRDDY
jgi:hypothetical protein